MRIMARGLDSVFFCGVQDTNSRALVLRNSCKLSVVADAAALSSIFHSDDNGVVNFWFLQILLLRLLISHSFRHCVKGYRK